MLRIFVLDGVRCLFLLRQLLLVRLPIVVVLVLLTEVAVGLPSCRQPLSVDGDQVFG